MVRNLTFCFILLIDEDFKENYLTTEEFESLNDLAGVLRDDGHFIDEKGHKVVLYGEQYRYTGSRLGEDTPDPIPHEIAALIDSRALPFY